MGGAEFTTFAVLAVVFQGLAVGLCRPRPHTAWVCQFAAYQALRNAEATVGCWPILLGVAALAIPLAYPLRGADRLYRWAAGGLLLCTGAYELSGVVDVWRDPTELIGRPMVSGQWFGTPSLKVYENTVVLENDWGHLRVMDWGDETTFDWNQPGGSGPLTLRLGNMGPLTEWSTAGNGTARLRPGAGSSALLDLEFPIAAGQVRLVPTPSTASTRHILVVGSTRGDLETLHRAVRVDFGSLPDAIILLGDMVADGGYLEFLSTLRIADGVGSRVIWVPGEREGAAESEVLPFDVRLSRGPDRDRLCKLPGLAVMVVDSTRGPLDASRFGLTQVRRALSFPKGFGLVAVHDPLLRPPESETPRMSDADRTLLLGTLPSLAMGLVVSAVEGPSFDWSEQGLRQIGVGSAPGGVDVAWLSITGDQISGVRFGSVERAPRAPVWRGWVQIRSLSEAHRSVGEDLAFGLAFVVGALWIALFPKRRKPCVPAG